MAKQITFEYGDKQYTLEFTRRSVIKMEKDGFDSAAAEKDPMSCIFELFAGAFIAHHANESRTRIGDIFESIDDLPGWSKDLGDMYKDTFEATNSNVGEIKRTKNW